MCPNGNSVNWKGVYGEDEFVIKPPVFESQLRSRRAMKRVDAPDLTQRAREFAEVCSSFVYLLCALCRVCLRCAVLRRRCCTGNTRQNETNNNRKRPRL